jgi:hypothetical protein
MVSLEKVKKAHFLLLLISIRISSWSVLIQLYFDRFSYNRCWTNMRTRTKRTRGTESPDAFIRLNMRIVRVAPFSFITQVERQLCIVNQGYAIVTKQQWGDRTNKFHSTIVLWPISCCIIAGILTRTKCAWSFPGLISLLAFPGSFCSQFVKKLEDLSGTFDTLLWSRCLHNRDHH